MSTPFWAGVHRTMTMISCYRCSKQSLRVPAHLKYSIRHGHTLHFCSNSCAARWRAETGRQKTPEFFTSREARRLESKMCVGCGESFAPKYPEQIRCSNRGMCNPRNRLTAVQRAAIVADNRTQSLIAAEYGVSQSYVSRLKQEATPPVPPHLDSGSWNPDWLEAARSPIPPPNDRREPPHERGQK